MSLCKVISSEESNDFLDFKWMDKRNKKIIDTNTYMTVGL